MLLLKVKVLCFNFEQDKKGCWVIYDIEVQFGDCLVDVFNEIKWYYEFSFIFCCLCQYGICGLDVMMINGCNCFVCKILVCDFVKGLGGEIIVELICGFKVECDLFVDMEFFFDVYWVIMFYFINEDLVLVGECFQSEVQVECMVYFSNCILCVCCIMFCFIFWVNGLYFGFVVIVQVYCFIFDSCDQVIQQWLNIMNQNIGVWCCCIVYNCIEVCLCEILIILLIEEVKCVVMFQQV